MEDMNGRDVTARIDCYCGYCKAEVDAEDRYCRNCGAKLVCAKKFDSRDMYATEYASERE